MDVQSVVERLKTTEGQRVTTHTYLKRAAILAFHPDPERFVTGALVKIGFFRSNDDLRYHDEVRGPLFMQVDQAVQMLRLKYLKAAISYKGIQRVETYPVPEPALREAVLNAVIHKDYSTGVPVQISVYDDKLMIWNPGQLPPSWTVAKLKQKHASHPFNPDLANVFFRAGDIEAWGRGIERIVAACRAAGFPEPVIEHEATGLWVTFPYSAKYLREIEGRGTDPVTPHETPEVTDPVDQVLVILGSHPCAVRNHQASAGLLMSETIRLGDIAIDVVRKSVKNVHLSVHPPRGRVTLVAPNGTRLEVARAYAATRLSWIRKQQASLRGQAREPRRRYVERESHCLWGRRYLLSVVQKDAKPSVSLGHRRVTLSMRPGSTQATRERVIQEWHRSLLHEELPPLIAHWEHRLDVKVSAYFLQRMKTKWGSCNPRKRTIRVNTELVKKPKDLLEYIVVHEMVHLLVPTHSERFTALLSQHYPSWREARAELNELPLAAELWNRP